MNWQKDFCGFAGTQPKFSADGGPDVGHGPGIAARCPADGRTGIENDNLQTDEHQPWLCAVDPAVAAGREAPKAASDSDGALAGPAGAFPTTEAETGGLSIAIGLDGRSPPALVGTARGGEPGGVKAN